MGQSMMELWDTESFTCLLNLSHFENRDERYFNDYACWVPLRFIQPNYINGINWWGCVLSNEKKQLTEYPIIKELCTQKNWSSFKYLNHWLIIDIINVPFKLHNCELIPKIVYGIMSQSQKPTKFVYTRTSLTSLEIAVMIIKRKFFLPNFISGTIYRELINFEDVQNNPEVDDWSYWVNSDPELNNKLQDEMVQENILIEIDVSAFNMDTCLIQPDQNPELAKAGICLISCYNLYEFQGFDLENNYAVLKLKLCPYSFLTNLEHIKIPEKYFKAGPVNRKRYDSAKNRHDIVNRIIDLIKENKS